MSEDQENTRLAGILVADVAGYDKLVEQDTGDGFLAEFPTVQSAVLCAISLRAKLANGALGFRMGINLGDIVDDGRDIHGEGINIAARLEALGDSGDICI